MFAKLQIATNKLGLTAVAVQDNGCASPVSISTWKMYLLASVAAIELLWVVIVWLNLHIFHLCNHHLTLCAFIQ